MYSSCFKRLFDFLGALFLLLALSPLLIVVWVCLTIANKGAGALFVQARPGLAGKIFHIYKFKTMTDERDTEGNLLPDEARLTKIGKIVRSLSIDELPQFFNVLKGDMSFIGPRPLLVQYLPLYSAFQARRHEVRPGISGWAQCNGRNAIEWQKKFELDVWYVDHCRFLLDVRIVWMTIKKIILRDSINSANAATMTVFEGDPLYLYGAGGHALVIKDILKANKRHVTALVDDNEKITEFEGLKVLRAAEESIPTIISIGNNKIRKKIADELRCDFERAIHPSAIIADSVSIGLGSVVMHGAVIQTKTSIGEHVIINTAASIDHECQIESFAHISPNCTLCGNVSVGEGTWIGAGSTVIPGVKIGKWCTIGAGSVVINDIPDHATVVGVPAKQK